MLNNIFTVDKASHGLRPQAWSKRTVVSVLPWSYLAMACPHLSLAIRLSLHCGASWQWPALTCPWPSDCLSTGSSEWKKWLFSGPLNLHLKPILHTASPQERPVWPRNVFNWLHCVTKAAPGVKANALLSCSVLSWLTFSRWTRWADWSAMLCWFSCVLLHCVVYLPV